MAIGRISGAMLFSDLDRQGQDLSFSTDGNILLYQNFSQFRIGVNTSTPTEILTVNGNFGTANLVIDAGTISARNGYEDIQLVTSGNIKLASIDRVKIAGGADSYVIQTDGNGNLRFANISTVFGGVAGDIIPLGNPKDGSLTDYAAYPRWTGDTTVTDAIDNLNQVMFNVYKGTFIQSVTLTSNVTSGPSPASALFTATPIGNANAYDWNFGDGTILSNVGNVVAHTYSNINGGIYTVTVTAYNTNGTHQGNLQANAQGSAAQTVATDYFTLYTPAPVPQFTLSATAGDHPKLLGLINTSLYAQTYSVFWGDNTPEFKINNNSLPGGTLGATLDHTFYANLTDAQYSVVLKATSVTAGPSPISANSNPTIVSVYRPQTPAFTNNSTVGNNQHTFYANGSANIGGAPIQFTNTTSTLPGPTATFPNNMYKWNWGDGTYSNVSIGSGAPGDSGIPSGTPLVHNFKLSNPIVQETFNVSLQVFTGHSTSPVSTTNTVITVKPAPTAQFTANTVVNSDKTGDTELIGYLYTDLTGANRANIGFYNSSINSTNYVFGYGDATTSANIGSGAGTPGTYIYHTYGSTGTFTANLNAVGPNSTSAADDTLTRTGYITIYNAPSAPAGLSSYSGSFNYNSAATGTNATLAANATNNSAGGTPTIPTAGTSVNRITTATTVNTAILSNVYDSAHGYLRTFFNNSIDGNVTFTTASEAGTYGNLVISSDVDAHSVTPGVYPTNFYKVWSGYHTKQNSAIPVGYNALTMQHSTTGNVSAGFVKDDLTSVPTLYSGNALMGTSTVGTLRYISGVPYFNTGAAIYVNGLEAYNWIGQTYNNTVSPITFSTGGTFESTSGSLLTAQSKSYSQIDGPTTFLSAGIPKAATGKTSATRYVFGNVFLNVNATNAVVGNIGVALTNVNGTSATEYLATKINLYSTAITGFDETNISCSALLGSGYTDSAKRIFISGASGATPAYNPATNYYTGTPFTGTQSVAVGGTDEATVRWGTVKNDTTDWSQYLPTGPIARTTGTQYLRIAFRRQTMANFKITYSGKISGLWIASPGSAIDSTSTLNGWLTGSSTYLGSGIPGANTALGGNGSNGCAKTSGDVIPAGTTVTNRVCQMTLGSENASNATGNQVFISIALAAGDSLTSLSIGP
jgi:hypothetical protein